MAISHCRRWRCRTAMVITITISGIINAIGGGKWSHSAEALSKIDAGIPREMPGSDDFTHRVANALIQLIERLKNFLNREE